MNDLISREAIIKWIDDLLEHNYYHNWIEDEVLKMVKETILKFPSINLETNIKVKVTNHPCNVSYTYYGICPKCNNEVYNGYPYCSECGSQLEWE